MIISIERQKNWTMEGHPEVKVAYKVPTAEDFEKIVTDKPSDCDLFKKFVTGISGVTDEQGTAYKPEDIVQLPGTWAIVTGVARGIVESATLGAEGKNE